MSRRCAAVACALALAATGCAHRGSVALQGGGEPRAGGEVGLASFYGHRFQGRRTASGARYDVRGFTCAHRRLPFGTRVRVTALESGRSVDVTVTDRGPYAGGRIVDLSLAAARALGMVDAGVIRVRVERLDEGGPDG